MVLAGVAPLLAFVALLVVLRGPLGVWRTAFLVAAVLWGVAAVVATEALSAVEAVRPLTVLGWWLGLTVILAWYQWRRPRSASDRRELSAVWPGGWDGRLAVGVAVLVGVVGVVALIASPNTYDSMTYHMSRVAHWAQNGSVGHYVTPVERQLHPPPWAEFAILQFYVLMGSDRLANMVQWFSMVGCVIGVSLVAKQLGGDRRAQILASVAAATIPMGLLEASGTKNDYVLAFWMTCLVVFILILDGRPKGARSGAWIALAGSGLGLALLTKGTAYVLCLPFAAWACLSRVRRDPWRAVSTALSLAGIGLGQRRALRAERPDVRDPRGAEP